MKVHKKKIQPLTDLKVLFADKPLIDDGGPKQELFSGEMMFLNCTVFSIFIFIYVIVELQSALRFLFLVNTECVTSSTHLAYT